MAGTGHGSRGGAEALGVVEGWAGASQTGRLAPSSQLNDWGNRQSGAVDGGKKVLGICYAAGPGHASRPAAVGQYLGQAQQWDHRLG